MVRLSKNFTLAEFTKSRIALKQNIENTPTDEHIENMKVLCEMILQPVRNHFGPISINSCIPPFCPTVFASFEK